MTVKLLVVIDISPDARARLESKGFEVLLAGELGGRAAAVAQATDARAVLTNGSLGLRAEEIAALPKLEIICAIGAGYEMIDVAAAATGGIVVTTGRGTNAIAVADHAFTLLLAIAGTIVPSHEAVRKGGWSNFSSPQRDAASPGVRSDFPYKRVGVTGRKLGIFGLGMIGREIAKRGASGFDMDVAYHNRKPVADTPYIYMASLGELAEWADFLVVAAPGGPDTYHAVNADILDRLGTDGFVVNIGRGTVLDTHALIDALHEGRIAGAALDVVEGEPEIPAELLAVPRLLLTPHMAGRTADAISAMVDLAVSNLVAFFAGDNVLNRVGTETVA